MVMSKFIVTASGFPSNAEVFAHTHEAAALKAYPILVKRMGWLPEKLWARLADTTGADEQEFCTEDFPPDILEPKKGTQS